MLLTERLAELGMTEADIIMVESAIEEKASVLAEAKAQDLLEAELKSINEGIEQTVSQFTDHFNGYAKVLSEGIESKYKSQFETEAHDIVENFKTQFEAYSSHIIAEAKNKETNQSDLKVAMAEELIESIQAIYGEYNIEMPKKADFEDTINAHVADLEESLQTLQKENNSLRESIMTEKKAKILESASASLSIKQKETFAELAESILFVDEDIFTARVTKLAESMTSKKDESQQITESADDVSDEKPQKPDMSKYIKAIKQGK